MYLVVGLRVNSPERNKPHVPSHMAARMHKCVCCVASNKGSICLRILTVIGNRLRTTRSPCQWIFLMDLNIRHSIIGTLIKTVGSGALTRHGHII